MKSSNKREKLSPNRRIIDYDIHGIVGIRLVEPTDKDAAVVANQLGLTQASLRRAPDIIIYFKKRLPASTLKYLGLDFAGFADEGFFVLKSNWAKTKVQIPFEKIGGQCEIICESGLGSIPLLSHIINFTFLKKNYIPLHASAFLYNGIGILVAGWATGGKTEALLSFAKHGAQYIGDEWIILSSDGQEMFGIPVPTSIKNWQFKYIPELLPKISKQQKTLFKSIHILEAIQRKFSQGKFKNFLPLKLLNKGLPGLRRQLKIWVSPREFFKNCFCEQRATPDKLFLIVMHTESDVKVEACDPMEIAQRMMSANEYEQLHFFEYYKAFKFAFPRLRNEFLENIDELQNTLIYSALEGKEAYKVLRPSPTVSLDLLFKEMQPYCREKTEISLFESVKTLVK